MVFTAAQNQDGYVSNWLDIDLKQPTETAISLLQCCWAVYMEMDLIFFSYQVWQKRFRIPPQGFPLQHQNCTLVGTGFFINNPSIVTLQTWNHWQRSWVIYRQCQPIFSVFPWTQPLIYTLMLTLSGMCSTCYTSSFNCNKSSVFLNTWTELLRVSVQSEQASPPFLCVLAVALFTPMMEDDNTRAFSVNLCILTESAQKVPRALFNHMLLHTFSPWWKQLGNVKEDSRKITFLHLFVWCFCICADLETSEEEALVYSVLS